MGNEAKWKLSRREWGWIVFVPILLTVVTLFNFVLFIPHYAASIAITYILVRRFPHVFNRDHYARFVIKVVGVAVGTFALLVLLHAVFFGLTAGNLSRMFSWPI